jgi:hypothetical protein
MERAVKLVVAVADDVGCDANHITDDSLHRKTATIHIGLDSFNRDAAAEGDRKFGWFVGGHLRDLTGGRSRAALVAGRPARRAASYGKLPIIGDTVRLTDSYPPIPLSLWERAAVRVSSSPYGPGGQGGVCIAPS